MNLRPFRVERRPIPRPIAPTPRNAASGARIHAAGIKAVRAALFPLSADLSRRVAGGQFSRDLIASQFVGA